MGLIREPEGVDFIIKSRPLTKREEELLSKFIKEHKAKRLKKVPTKKRATKEKTSSRKRTTV